MHTLKKDSSPVLTELSPVGKNTQKNTLNVKTLNSKYIIIHTFT